MAEFITKCPHCNAELQVQDEWIGMELECPSCRSKFVLQGNVPYPAAAGKPCPFCRNMIDPNATYCKFCKQYLMGNGFRPSSGKKWMSSENPILKLWNKIPLRFQPGARIVALILMAYLFLGTCSGVFYVWYDNALIKGWKLEKRVQVCCFDFDDEPSSISAINYVLDNIGSFFSGFFFLYGEDTFCNENRLLNKLLYRYGINEKNAREAMLKNIDIMYAAKKQQAENEGRYLDY